MGLADHELFFLHLYARAGDLLTNCLTRRVAYGENDSSATTVPPTHPLLFVYQFLCESQGLLLVFPE